MQFSFPRLAALIRKELIEILRDRRFIILVLAMTLVQLFVYSYAAARAVYHLPLAVVDESRDRVSRGLIQALVNSQYFDVKLDLPNQAAATHAIDRGEVKAALVIPPRLAAGVAAGSADVLFLLDGSDSFAVRSGNSAANLVTQAYAGQLDGQTLVLKKVTSGVSSASGGAAVRASTQVLYNSALTDSWFVLPGIIGMILQTLAVEQAALFIVRERELGTVEQILATPARQLELILSKVVPLALLCLVALGISLGVSVFWFGVPFEGSLWLYFWLALLFIASCLGLGFLIATRAETQLEAESLSLIFMLFGILLSGLFFPRDGMPLVPQIIGDLAPLTYFIRISRAIYSKGVGLQFLWSDALILAAYTLVVIAVAARRFKMRLD